MELAAIHHSLDRRFCYALAPGTFLIRIKVKKEDIRRITLHTVDKYMPLTRLDTRRSQPMLKVASDGISDYFEAVVSIDVVCLRYFFRLEDSLGTVRYYGNNRFYNRVITRIDDMFDCPQNLREEEQFHLPQWAANQVVYQIFPSRFASSHPVPDKQWYQSPISSSADLRGDLPGVCSRLPYLKELGVDVVYMTPVFQSNSSHKYDTVDYYKIDPSFGTEADLRKLVDTAHGLGMRVILDAVFNHTSRDFFAFRDIREKGAASAYLDWYYIKSFPLQADYGQKPSYKTFSYYGGMPKLNVKNPQVEAYLLDVVRYWMRSCHIDGWRLDVGDEVNHGFWKKFRQVVKQENPEALIVGEVWHYAADFLDGDEWDTMMHYDFRRAVLGFAAWGSVCASQFADRMGFFRGTVHAGVHPLLWNLIGSHDTDRALHSCSENKQRLRLAAAMQLLSPGMPMIYYGDECGMTGGPDPDCRRGMIWKESMQDRELFHWYQTLISLRKSHPVITEGVITDLFTDDKRGILAITRELDGKKLTLVFYNGAAPVSCKTLRGFDLLSGQTFTGTLQPCQAMVLV